MAEPVILYQKIDTIGHLILNSPPKNEMNNNFFREFARIKEELFPKLHINGMIVYGKGRHFSSGANIEELKYDVLDKDYQHFLYNVTNILTLKALPFPVVAAISGSCFGSALELALACDYRVAAHRAIFGLPEATFNLMPGCGGTLRLPKLVGTGKAIELILTGRSLIADEAKEIGLIDIVADRKDLIKTAEKLINKMKLFQKQ